MKKWSLVSECWDTLGIGRGARRVPLDGDKHYATISYMAISYMAQQCPNMAQ